MLASNTRRTRPFNKCAIVLGNVPQADILKATREKEYVYNGMNNKIKEISYNV